MERWTDVGPLLQAARADMKVDQLIHTEAFSLFEAMSALEAGNPKMDAAAAPTAEQPTLEALLADPAIAPWDLSSADLVDVLDQLLSMEASWHSGASAMQTVYACLYMLKMDSAGQLDSAAGRALLAYCSALRCDCAAVRDLVLQGGVCEEEDINIFTPGIPFEPPAGAADAALSALDAAIEAASAPAPTAADGDGSGALGQAVAARLRLRRALRRGLTQAASNDPKEVAAAGAHFAEARQLVALVRETSRLAAAAPAPAPAAAPASSSTAQSAAVAGPQAAGAPALGPAFRMDVNRHLLGPAPPRQVQVMPVSDALSYLERLTEHLQVAAAVSEHVHDYRSLQLYLWRFARMRPGAVARSLMHTLIVPERWQAQQVSSTSSEAPQPSGGSSAASDSAAPGGARKGGKKGGKGQEAAAAADGPSTSGSAPEIPAWVPTKHMIAAACMVSYKAGMPEEADVFFEQAVIAVANVCQALCMNRCRCRRRLRRCVDDWLNMWHHGFNADVVPAFKEHLRATGWRWRPLDGSLPDEDQGPLSLWVEVQAGATMLHHLLLGFQLELYEPLEYDMLYWYCDYLCTCMIGAASALIQRCPPMTPPPPPTAAGLGGKGLGRGLGGKGRGGSDAARAAAAAAALAQYEKEQVQLRYEVLEVEAMQHMCQGMLRLMAGLRAAGALPGHREAPPFNGGPQRFEQRFGSFAALPRPPPLSFADYETSMDVGRSGPALLLNLAARSFKEARARCPSLTSFAPHPDVASGWVRGLERAAAMNAVVSGVMAAKVTGEDKLKWECDWSHHSYFPAIALPKPAPAAPAPAPTASA